MHYLSSFGFFSAQIVSKISHVARYAPSFTSNLTTSSSSSLGIARASSALLSLVRRLSSKINPKSKQLIFRTYLQGVTEVICVTTIEFYHIRHSYQCCFGYSLYFFLALPNHWGTCTQSGPIPHAIRTNPLPCQKKVVPLHSDLILSRIFF